METNAEDAVARRVEENLDLADKLAARAWRRVGRAVPAEDLCGYARLGLVEAARRYVPDRGASFRTFAGYRIIGAVQDGLRHAGWLSRREYRHGQAQVLVVDVERASSRPMSDLDRELAAALVAPTTADPEVAASESDLATRVRSCIDALPPREREVIRRTYLDTPDGEVVDVRTVAAAVGLGKSRTWRVRANALRRLQQNMEAR